MLQTVCEFWQLLTDVSANQVVDCLLVWLSRTTSASSQRSAVLGLLKVLPRCSDEQRHVYLSSVSDVMRRCQFSDKQVRVADLLTSSTTVRPVCMQDYNMTDTKGKLLYVFTYR